MNEEKMIAALFVETNGTYFGLPNVDPWDIKRDARKYDGPYSVVAHPPCQLWGNFAAVNYARWGGEHNKPGNDQGCFASALKSVRKYGGVIEHPAFSKAWKTYSLPRPNGIGWNAGIDGEWVCEVWQSAYGHKARKRTWLYYCGNEKPEDMNWERKDGTHQIGFHDQRGKERNKPTLYKKEANATPVEFRDALIRIARKAV
jgi:hypothetical protein